MIQRIPGIVVRTVIETRSVSFFATTDQDTIMGQNAWGYFYEPEELAMIGRHFTPGGTFLDVGANIGNHTIYAALFLRARQVIPIEPNPDAIQILQINIDLNRLHSIVDTAYLGYGLAERKERAAIGRTIQWNLGGTTLVRDPAGAIPLATGDELLDDRPVEFIKVDVEGMELQVLSGLTRTIERYRPNLFVEVDNAHQAEFLKWAEVMGYGVAETYNRYGSQENFGGADEVIKASCRLMRTDGCWWRSFRSYR